MKLMIFACLALLGSSCTLLRTNEAGASAATAAPGVEAAAVTAPVVVYKTKKDYRNKVPVTLSADKARIIAYPAPEDLQRSDGSYMYPTSLGEGYLLDNRGVGPNTAFLKWSYEEYAALKERPRLDELKSGILDADPMLELYRCGELRQTTNLEDELNRMIKNNTLASLCTAASAGGG